MEVYKNGSLLATRNVSSWQYYANGGYIGVWFIAAEEAVLDNFGGGTVQGGQGFTNNNRDTSRNRITNQEKDPDPYDVELTNAEIFWQGIAIGSELITKVTFTQLNKSANEQNATRQKPQSNGLWGEDVIQVLYDVPNNRIQVWKFEGKAWVQVGADIPIQFVDGDVFTVFANKDGTVEIYHAGQLLSTRQPVTLQGPTPTLTETPIQKDASAPEPLNFLPVSYNLPAPQQQSSSLIIDYTYDPLNRLIAADYSDGRNFAYTYDAAGNVLELEQNLGPGTIITAYTYDEANQLETAQQGSTTWQYTYDANGSLISDGVKNYTYDSANRLVQVSDQLSVTSLFYNGLGQRLSMDAAGVIATYVLDGDRPLTATSNNNTTFYLYGLGAIGEETNAWSYSLPDGTNTPRQLSDLNGEVTLAGRYTPWGGILEVQGTGDFTFGYLGGILDGATNLIYVGNGQYYDPSTGRFLTRDVNPNSTNPYVPWNPIGAILGPLAVLSMFYGRKKTRNKWDTLVILIVLGISMGIGVVACAPVPPGTPVPQPTSAPINNTPPSDPNPNTSQEPGPAPTETSTPTEPPPPINTPSLPDCPAPTYYVCSASGSNVCIDPAIHSPVEQIAHTVFGEGGAFGGSVAANIIQTVLNRAYIYWEITHHAGINPNNIPWNQMTRKQLTDLFLFILSEPTGNGHPAYNAWEAPYPHSGLYWQRIVDAVDTLLDDAGAHPQVAKLKVGIEGPAHAIRSDINVIWYAASKIHSPERYVHKDTITRNGQYCFAQYYDTEHWNPPDEVLDCP